MTSFGFCSFFLSSTAPRKFKSGECKPIAATIGDYVVLVLEFCKNTDLLPKFQRQKLGQNKSIGWLILFYAPLNRSYEDRTPV